MKHLKKYNESTNSNLIERIGIFEFNKRLLTAIKMSDKSKSIIKDNLTPEKIRWTPRGPECLNVDFNAIRPNYIEDKKVLNPTVNISLNAYLEYVDGNISKFVDRKTPIIMTSIIEIEDYYYIVSERYGIIEPCEDKYTPLGTYYLIDSYDGLTEYIQKTNEFLIEFKS